MGAQSRCGCRDAVERNAAKMGDRIDGIRNCPDGEPPGSVAMERDSVRRSGVRVDRWDRVKAMA